MIEVGERIKKIRRVLNCTQKELSKEISMSAANLLRMEKGTLEPNYKLLAYLHFKHNINVNWIMTGQGEMFLDAATVQEKSPQEKAEEFLKEKYPNWKSSHYEIGKEILEEIGDTFILSRMYSYLEVAKKERDQFMSKE